jgi:hypothetical protein
LIDFEEIIATNTKALKRLKTNEGVRYAAQSLLDACGYRPSVIPSPVEKIALELGIPVTTEKAVLCDAGLRHDESGWQVLIEGRQVSRGKWSGFLTPRARFSLGHELGHYFIHCVGKVCPEVLRQWGIADHGTSHSKERACDIFAGELLVPHTLLDSPGFLKDLARKEESSTGLCIASLEALRCRLSISRHVLLSQMDRSKCLEVSETGLLMSTLLVEPSTGRGRTLRVQVSALPSWGFIPRGISLDSLNLKSGIEHFAVKRQDPIVPWRDTVRVYATTWEKGQCYVDRSPRDLKTGGEHAVFARSAGQQYMISTVRWPQNWQG